MWNCLLSFLFLGITASAQNVITTIAGTDYVFHDDGKPAVQAQLGQVSSVAVDPSGSVYTGDLENHLVYRIAPDGTVKVFAGNGLSGNVGEGGPASLASFAAPLYIATDGQGNFYVADTFTQSIRRIDANGIVARVAGTGSLTAYSGDSGPAIAGGVLQHSRLGCGA